MYQRWILSIEERMHRLDDNRVVRPFAWGLDCLGLAASDGQAPQVLCRYVDEAFQDSRKYYALKVATPYRLEENILTYPSAVQTQSIENNTVCARFFPLLGAESAVVVLPQWNARTDSHMALCRLLNRFGMAALRLSLPYHDARRPPELARADYLVDANIGRTLQSNRQAVLDTRMAVEWLWQQGFRRIGILGTSIGASIGFLTFVHEERLQASVLNHASSYFADVVWAGMTTRHVRQGLDGHVTLDELRRYWSIISPLPFVCKLRGQSRRTLAVSARFDPTFLPHLTRNFLDEFRHHGVPLKKVTLPCGHYTLGMFPFNWIDGYIMARFLKHALDFSRKLH